MSDVSRCQLCGEPMPHGEEMFNYHGFSGPCPKPPLPKPRSNFVVERVSDSEWRIVENGAVIVARCAFQKDAWRVCNALNQVGSHGNQPVSEASESAQSEAQ